MELQYRAILFDNDGTLVNTEKVVLEAFHTATSEVLGYNPPDEEMLSMVGMAIDAQMARFTDDPEKRHELAKIYRARTAEVHDDLAQLYPDVAPALAELKNRGFRMALVTSKAKSVAEHGLEHFGIREYFDVVIAGEDSEKHKPDPQPLCIAAERIGAPLSECVYVGDSPFDMEAAHNAPMTSVEALWGFFKRADVERFDPCYYCEKFADLTKLPIFRECKSC